jgi:hypothetical protein
LINDDEQEGDEESGNPIIAALKVFPSVNTSDDPSLGESRLG